MHTQTAGRLAQPVCVSVCVRKRERLWGGVDCLHGSGWFGIFRARHHFACVTSLIRRVSNSCAKG